MRKKTNRLACLLTASLVQALPAPYAFANRSPANYGRPGFEKVTKARGLADEGKTDDAVKILMGAINSEKDRERRALLHMTLGLLSYQAARDQQAEEQLSKAIGDGLRVPEYAYYHRGMLLKKAGKFKEAKADFDKVVDSKAPRSTANEATLQIGEIQLAEKQWKLAAKTFTKLRKAMRGNEKYPDVLWNLIRSEAKSTRLAGCKWVRELYSKYPMHAATRDWGAALELNKIEGQPTRCTASASDLKTRIRRLWLGGDADRAEAELKTLKNTVDEDGVSNVDQLMANHLASEGQVDEALKLLLKHYDDQRNRPGYLSLLARISTRAGEYQAAIASYQRAFDLAPRGRNAADSLFQAAFTSYQIQDYDGASRRFEQLSKAFPASRLAREAKWYLAWMRYLRGDYPGAHESLNALAQAPKPRKGRRSLPAEVVSSDRLRYWSAMSLLKMEKKEEAINQLSALARDPAVGYYALLSYFRLQTIPGAKMPAGLEMHLGLKKSGTEVAPTEEELKAAAAAVESQAGTEYADGTAPEGAAPADPVEPQSLEEVAEAAAPAEPGETPAGEEAEPTDVADEKPGSFKDAGMTVRFERARDLMLVGLEDAARRELREIEKRARTPADRKLLMNEYAALKNFDRSSYIGDISFAQARLREGLRGDGRAYWEYAYPRAFDSSVEKASKATGVPEQMIWGIMRAESHFRDDAQSAVGALGLMQLMPFTGRKVASLMNISSFETRSLLDPETNIKLGSRYLQRLLEKFSGSIPLVAASYNAGPHRAHAWVLNFGSLNMDEFIEHIPFVETRNYVKRVVRNYQIYNLLYKGGTQQLGWLVQPVGVQLEDKVPTKEIW